jgi:hypothetical protein
VESLAKQTERKRTSWFCVGVVVNLSSRPIRLSLLLHLVLFALSVAAAAAAAAARQLCFSFSHELLLLLLPLSLSLAVGILGPEKEKTAPISAFLCSFFTAADADSKRANESIELFPRKRFLPSRIFISFSPSMRLAWPDARPLARLPAGSFSHNAVAFCYSRRKARQRRAKKFHA